MSLNLVAYGASDDESDQEMEETPGTQAVILHPPVIKPSGSSTQGLKTAIAEETDTDIPQPSEKELQLAELAKREKANILKTNLHAHVSHKKNGKIVIGVPSLADLEEDDEEKKIKKPTFSAGKGQSKLFTQLPPPKNSSYESPAATPPVAPTIPKKSTSLIPHAVAKKQATKKASDDEDDASGSFFTMDEPELNVTAEPEPILPPVSQSPAQVESSYYTAMPTNQQYNMAGLPESVVQQTHEQQMELDDIALQALQGTSGTKRKLPDDAQIIEIKGERLTYDPNNSYIKAISEERVESRGPEIAYSKVHKKKHQITYLAAQAKAREVELKNQWAQNRTSKRQTQAKYGF